MHESLKFNSIETLADFLFQKADEFLDEEDVLTLNQFKRLAQQKPLFDEKTVKAGDLFRCPLFAVKKRFYLEEVALGKREWHKAEESWERVRSLALDNFLKQQLLRVTDEFEVDKLIRLKFNSYVFVSEVDLFQPSRGWFIEIKNSRRLYHFDRLQLAFFSFSKRARKLAVINIREKSVLEFDRDELEDDRKELLRRFQMFETALRRHSEAYARPDTRFCPFCPLRRKCEFSSLRRVEKTVVRGVQHAH